jgi:hypothetical protein
MTPTGKILPRRLTGCCAKHQRRISHLIKKARHIGLFAYKQGSFQVVTPFAIPQLAEEREETLH